MAMIPVIEDLDRCKIALQWVAEMQSDSLTAVLEILLERLDDTIGQVHAQLRPDHPPSSRGTNSVSSAVGLKLFTTSLLPPSNRLAAVKP